MQFFHLSTLRRNCSLLAGPFLFSACIGFAVLSYAQETAPPETAPSEAGVDEAGAAQTDVAPAVADESQAQASAETNPDRAASGEAALGESNSVEANPVEQLPEAPEPKTSPRSRASQSRAWRKPLQQPAAAPQPGAISSASAPAITPASTSASTPGRSTPGAFVPDSGWDIRDAPVRRSTPRAGESFPNFPLPPGHESLRSVAARMNLSLPLPQGRIVVDKSERRLDIYNGSTLLKSYHVALGNNPAGHKAKQGDGRTPEGDFYICTRNAKTSAFHIFLGLSYPALPDARRAANSKQITWREYQIIHQRLASRGRPLWETNLGGWVGIHGGTDATFAQKKRRERGTPDWTAGCIALTNREIEEIHAATRLGTPVKVQP